MCSLSFSACRLEESGVVAVNDPLGCGVRGGGIAVPQKFPGPVPPTVQSPPHFFLGLLASPVFSPTACPEFPSFFPPFKDQKGPREVLHRGLSNLFPKPGRSLPSSLSRAWACEPHRIHRVWWSACIPQRNLKVPTASSDSASGNPVRLGRGEKGNPDFHSTGNSSTLLGRHSTAFSNAALWQEMGQPSTLSSGPWAPPAGVRSHLQETPFVFLGRNGFIYKVVSTHLVRTLMASQGLKSQRCKAQIKDTSPGDSFHWHPTLGS